MSEDYGVYVILSQTGTAFSRALKVITGDEYNHASISLRADLARMYSFGRRHPYNPFDGGFVLETIHSGTFKRFSDTECIVLYKAISEEQHRALKEELRAMYRDKMRYGYNYMGVMMAGVKQIYKSRHERYYCSEFVREMLIRHGIEDAARFPDIVKPLDLLNLQNSRIVYRGKLRDYRANPVRELLKKGTRPYLLR